MGAYPLFCGGYSIFRGEQHFGDYVQPYGDAQWENGPADQPALPALGGETALEFFRGCHTHQEVVGDLYAACHISLLHPACSDHSLQDLLPDTHNLLDNSPRKCHPRHCG